MDAFPRKLHVGFICFIDKYSTEFIYQDVSSFEYFNGDLVIKYIQGGYTFIPLKFIEDDSVYWVD